MSELPPVKKGSEASTTEDDKEREKLVKMYGRAPQAMNKGPLSHKLKDRKYFDSGDYALSKAGKSTTVGSEHPNPSTIPHSHPDNIGIPTSPIKEPSSLKQANTPTKEQ